jgi:hypothetical protein
MVERGPIAKELQRELKKLGYTAIYSMKGETIADQKKEENLFWYITSVANNHVSTVRSLVGDVAFNPLSDKFFIAESNFLAPAQQLDMVAGYSDRLQRLLQTTEVEAIVGEAPTYSGIAFAHLMHTDERLFGVKYGYRYASTVTRLGGSGVAVVGRFDAGRGLGVDRWLRFDRADSVWAAPLVVRAAAVGR